MLSDPCALMESRSRLKSLQIVVFNKDPVPVAKKTCIDIIYLDLDLISLLLTKHCCFGSWSVSGPQAVPGQRGEGRSPLPWVGSDLWHIFHVLEGTSPLLVAGGRLS